MSEKNMLSIIIPCYNGSKILAKQLPPFKKFLDLKNVVCEIIIVDDGSEDSKETKLIASKYDCKYLANKKNLGKGGAVRNGVFHAKGNYIIYTDVDIPFKYNAFLNALYYLDFKEYDMIIGDRSLPESIYFNEITLLRRIGSAIFTFIIGRFVTTGMSDTQCGFKGFNKNIAMDLFSHSVINGFSFDVEIIYISLKRNYDIKKIPVQLRNNESSSVRLISHGFMMLKELIHIKMNHLKGIYNKNES